MTKSRTVRVTTNLQLCLRELRVALKALPAGEPKTRGRRALAYLERTFAGQRQPREGGPCSPERALFW